MLVLWQLVKQDYGISMTLWWQIQAFFAAGLTSVHGNNMFYSCWMQKQYESWKNVFVAAYC